MSIGGHQTNVKHNHKSTSVLCTIEGPSSRVNKGGWNHLTHDHWIIHIWRNTFATQPWGVYIECGQQIWKARGTTFGENKIGRRAWHFIQLIGWLIIKNKFGRRGPWYLNYLRRHPAERKAMEESACFDWLIFFHHIPSLSRMEDPPTYAITFHSIPMILFGSLIMIDREWKSLMHAHSIHLIDWFTYGINYLHRSWGNI